MFRIVEQRIAQLEAQNTTALVLYATDVGKPFLNTQSVPDNAKSTIPAPVHASTCTNHMIYPVKFSNLNIFTNDNIIGLSNLATAVATAVSISSPVTMFKLGNFTPRDIKQYIHSILTQMNTNNYFSPLLTTESSCN